MSRYGRSRRHRPALLHALSVGNYLCVARLAAADIYEPVLRRLPRLLVLPHFLGFVACPRSVDRPLLRWSFDIGFLLLSATPAHHFPASLPSGGFTLGASSFVTPWGLITHSRFLPFVRRAHHRHLPSFSRPDLLAAAVELCLALPAAALGLVLLLLRPPLAYVSSARTPSFRAFGPPVPSLSFG